jgi:hypothetical protein
VEENLEGSTSERLQSINTKADLSIQDSEFEKAADQVRLQRKGQPSHQESIAG